MTHRHFRTLSLIVLLNTTLLALGQTTIVWSYWGDPGELPPNDEVVEAFEAQYPEIDIEVQHAPWGSYFDRLQTQMAGGTAPDVMFLNNIPSYASRGVLMPLNERIAADDFDTSSYLEGLLDVFSHDGQIYGFARDNDTNVLYYNADLFDAAGLDYPNEDWQWDDMREAAAALTVKDARGRAIQYGLALEKNRYPAWIYQNGGRIVDDPLDASEFYMDSDEATEAIQYIADLILEDGSVPSFDAMQELGSTTELFSTGRVAMVMTNAARMPTFMDASFDWNIAPLPAGPNGLRANSLGGAGYVMSSTTDHPEEAWTFLKFLAGPEGQSIFAKTGVAVPASFRDPAVSRTFRNACPDGIDCQVFIDETGNGIAAPVFPGWREIENTIVIPHLDLVFTGELDAETALSRMAERVRDFMAAN
ncbi:MAG: sugar ABC transporter substrate-binding protein [Trueperaceae bacterium]